jgi:hypothetical protein
MGIKRCPKCPMWLHSNADKCLNCGHDFKKLGKAVTAMKYGVIWI